MKGKRVRNIQAERFDRTTGTLLSGRYKDVSEGINARQTLKTTNEIRAAIKQLDRLAVL